MRTRLGVIALGVAVFCAGLFEGDARMRAQGAAPPAATSRTLTAVAGISVGHHTLGERPTGCTVILVEGGAVGGVSLRGGAPGTRETDVLNPLNSVDRVNAVVLSGGSAFGLDAASGVVRWLDERGIGWPTDAGVVPIVTGAVLYDLSVGTNPSVRPTADCGYRAAGAATTGPVVEGSVGAGAGATVGKMQAGTPAGPRRPTKAGIGSAAIVLPNGLVVAAIAAVNAVGDIVDPATGQVVAGARKADGTFVDLRKVLRAGGMTDDPRPGGHTTLAVVATNAVLSKVEINRVALMADDGLARAIYPAHTAGDGDTVFALATGRWKGETTLSTIGALAADALAEAIVRAATEATGVAGIPARRDLK
jgi:L-aminopeptidase/D-esterase-like protein